MTLRVGAGGEDEVHGRVLCCAQNRERRRIQNIKGEKSMANPKDVGRRRVSV